MSKSKLDETYIFKISIRMRFFDVTIVVNSVVNSIVENFVF